MVETYRRNEGRNVERSTWSRVNCCCWLWSRFTLKEDAKEYIPRKVGQIWPHVIDRRHARSASTDLVLLNGQQNFIAF